MHDIVIGDGDGVLVDSAVLAVEAVPEVLVAAGVPAWPAMIASRFGMKLADLLASVVEASAFGVQGARTAGMRAIGFLCASRTVPDHGAELLASGAEAALAAHAEVGRRLAIA